MPKIESIFILNWYWNYNNFETNGTPYELAFKETMYTLCESIWDFLPVKSCVVFDIYSYCTGLLDSL